MTKPKVASDWLAGCAGCHMSFLDMDERIIELTQLVDLRSTPITDLTEPDEDGVDVGILEGGITNGEELRVRAYMKPISTLRKPLASVDIDTKEASEAAFERSDITAVPAAGVIGEAKLAVVLVNELREKFGGDSIDEMKRNSDAYLDSVKNY